ncbi:myosin-11-like, partial [Trifolium medium]|nr:myosin-11-like [Trifolium medium]
MQESNAELVLAVQDLEEMLEQKNSDMCKCNHSNKHEHDKNSQELEMKLSKCETDDEDQKALDELVKEKSDAKETHLLEKKIIDLYGEIEMYRRDKEELEMQIEQI